MNFELARGAHVCHLFQNQDEQKDVALRFLKAGLERGEDCAFVVSDRGVDAWQFELQASGIDVVTAQDAGALHIIAGSEWRLPGEFNTVLMARSVWRRIEAALLRAPGMRLLTDLAWAHESGLDADQLCHWEASANLIFEDAEVRTICQYDLASHSPASIHAGLRTHPIVLLDGRRLANPFYEARRILKHEPLLNRSDADADAIEAMLSRLREMI